VAEDVNVFLDVGRDGAVELGILAVARPRQRTTWYLCSDKDVGSFDGGLR
jgi:hypothetical protein